MNGSDKYPATQIDTLIPDIIEDLTPEERFSIADLQENELRTLELVMGKYMKFRIKQLNEQGNRKLLKECQERSGDDFLDDAGAASFILRESWSHIRETHRLIVVK